MIQLTKLLSNWLELGTGLDYGKYRQNWPRQEMNRKRVIQVIGVIARILLLLWMKCVMIQVVERYETNSSFSVEFSWIYRITDPSAQTNGVLDYVHMRGEMYSNRHEISFRLKIWLRCSVSPLLVSTWTEMKWNSKRYGFHIGHFDRNEISKQHEIFM